MSVQQKLVNNKWFRLGVSVLLTLAVLLVFVCAPWSCAHAIVGVDDAVIVILIAALAGCGITFASTGAFNTLEEYVGHLFQEYASDNNTTVFALTNGLQSNSNKLGQLLLNNRWVVLINGFVSWLKIKLSLANNETKVLVPNETTIDGLTSYQLPLRFDGNDGWDAEYLVVLASAAVYGLLYRINEGSLRKYIGIEFWAEEAATVQIVSYRPNGDVNATFSVTLTQDNTSGLYVGESTNITLHTDNVDFTGYQIYSRSTVIEAVTGSNPETVVGSEEISVKTGSITAPNEMPTYNSGDGAVVDVGADWTTPYPNVIDGIPQTWPDVVADDTVITLVPELEADIVEQVPAQTDIENLPGGSSFGLPVGFGELRLSDIWHYVHQWVVDTSVAGGLLWNTANAMASPVVNMVFAMVVIAIVFGTLKHLRSH